MQETANVSKKIMKPNSSGEPIGGGGFSPAQGGKKSACQKNDQQGGGISILLKGKKASSQGKIHMTFVSKGKRVSIKRKGGDHSPPFAGHGRKKKKSKILPHPRKKKGEERGGISPMKRKAETECEISTFLGGGGGGGVGGEKGGHP